MRFRYQNAVSQGEKTALEFAEILSEYTALTFDSVARTLNEAEKIRKDSVEGEYPTSEDTNAALRLLVKTSPVVVAVGWTDASGELIAHSYDRAPPRTNVSGMPHFDSQRDGTEHGFYIVPPFRSAVSDKWFTAASLTLLRNAMGDQNAASLLKLFVVEARDRFVLQPTSAEARESISQEAHSFGGSAGMLGFEDLAQACLALQSAGWDDNQFDGCLERCRRGRDAALRKIAELMVDDSFVSPAQSTA